MKTEKVYSPNNLPFLQAQTLERIYLNISKGKQTTIEEVSLLTDYPIHSKILSDAIESLVRKGFVIGSLYGPLSFSVPEKRLEFFQRVIERNDYTGKHYSRILLDNFANHPTQLRLFLEKQGTEELNKHGIIHRWYSYLEDFPYWLIGEKIKEYKLNRSHLAADPFCGSGTTLVSANLLGVDAIGFDANPLMAFISRVKTRWDIDLSELGKEISKIANNYLAEVGNDKVKLKNDFISKMPKKEINQWLSPVLQREVSILKDNIGAVKDTSIRELFLLAMSKSCFDASHVSLCPGTTFYPFREKRELWDLFTQKTMQIYEDLKVVQQHDGLGRTKVINDTCLECHKYADKNSIDFIITSPPYPNDLEYTRQARLELYLLDFVRDMNDIQRIKRKMIKGSTKLIFKDSNSERYVHGFKEIMDVANNIYQQTRNKNWGFDYPRMVKEYFGDMYLCLKEMYPLLTNGSHFLLVVGDQTIKGVLIPVGDILISIALSLGYKKCRKELLRIRRSTGHNIPLPEEIIVLEK